MADTDKTVVYGVSADASPFETGMNKAASAAQDAADKIGVSFNKMQDAVALVQKSMIALTAVIAGGKFFDDAVGKASAYNSQVSSLSKTMGISITQAAGVNVALKSIGKSSDDLTSASFKLLRQINSNEVGIKALGLQTRGADGNLRNMMDLMVDGVKVLSEYKEGADRDSVAMTMFGKSAQEVMSLQKLTAETLKHGTELAEKYGLVIGKDNVAGSKKLKEAQEELKIASESLSIKIGEMLIPMCLSLANLFLVTLPNAIKASGTAFEKFADDTVKASYKSSESLFENFRKVEAFLDSLRPKWIKEANSEYWARAEAHYKETAEALRDATAEEARFIRQAEAAKQPGEGGKRAPKPAGPAAPSRMGEWEAKLADTKAALERQGLLEGQFREMSKAAEQQYWDELKAKRDLSATERIAISRKTADIEMAGIKQTFEVEVAKLQTEAAAYKNNTDERLRLERLIQAKYQEGTKEYEACAKKIVEIQRQASEQIKQVKMMEAQASRDVDMFELQGRQQIAQLELQLGTITQAQMLDKQRQFENDKAAIQLAGLKERETIALNDPDRNLIEIARIHQEIEQAERQHQLALSAIRMQSTMQSQQYTLNATNAMGAGFQGVFAKAMQGGLSLRGVMQGLWQAMTNAVTNMLASMAAQWLMLQVKQMIFGKVAAISKIAGLSAEAGAGGVASMAAAPFPLNMSAPAFGAGMAALAMSFAPMAAASGGYDIPGSINPIVQAHAREMILPAKHADVIRNMADGGQGGSGGGDIHIHGSPSDSIQLKDLPAVLKKLNRNFHFV